MARVRYTHKASIWKRNGLLEGKDEAYKQKNTL
jgi:hypothetical protein